ncbi:MAG: hypothetical protein AB7K52_13970 [Phycisphaerales bacterium]
MPRLPTLRVSALAELAEQLRFVPARTARRHVERAEDLLATLDTGALYTEDELVRRITGYRPELESPAAIPGEALLQELGALIERLSVHARYERDELAGWISVEELAAKWSIARRTIERYRRAGLAGRRARNPRRPTGNGKEVLLFSPRTVAWFEEANRARLERGRGFGRIGAEQAEEMGRRAEAYRRRLGLTRGQSAARLGQRYGRSRDGVRRLLARREEPAERSAARTRGQNRERESRLIERALRWRGAGVRGGASAIARRVRRTVASVHRIGLKRRAAMLRRVAPERPSAGGSAFADERRAREILGANGAALGLGSRGPRSIGAFVAATLEAGWPDPRVERERARAWAFLRWRAARGIEALADRAAPGAREIDRIETDLLWASRLKAELARGEGMLLLKTVEARLGQALVDLHESEAASLYRVAIESLIAPGEGVDLYDPFKGGRVAAPAGVALNRAISRWETEHGGRSGRGGAEGGRGEGSGRATRIMRPSAGGVVLADWTRRVDPWQAWLEPPEEVRERLEEAGEESRRLLRMRFGWLEGPPRRLEELAREMDCRAEEVTRRLKRALREVMRS